MAILVGWGGPSQGGSVAPEWLARHGARLALLAGLILLIGTAVGLGTLWLLQRQPTAQWEYVALGTTTNSYPILLLSAVLL